MKNTKDYSIFKDVTANREIIETHVRALMKSIEEKNLLYANPILVSKNMEVIDGQHRLEVAKRLNLDVYYIIADVTLNDISKLNSRQKNWRLIDYINFYTIEKRPDFVTFSKFMNKNDKFALVSLLALVNSRNTRGTPDIKEGFIDIEDITNAEYIINVCNSINEEFVKDFVYDNAFSVALKTATKNQKFNMNIFKEKIRQAPREFVPCRNKKDYLQMIQDNYNHNLSSNKILLV